MKLYRYLFSSLFLLLVVTVLGCGGASINNNSPVIRDSEASGTPSNNNSEGAARTITYLGKEYIIPVYPKRILFMSAFESMEDAVLLGVEPYAASAIGDETEPFPGFYGTVMKHTIPLMGSTEDSIEYLLELAPDLIISTDMETSVVYERLGKIAPVIPVSHFGPDWQANLELLAQITGTSEKAQSIIEQYKKLNEDTRAIVSQLSSDTEVLAIRLRGGELMIYPENVFLNDVLYEQLGFKVPKLIKATTQQSVLSLEGLVAANPDYIFLQYDIYENGGSEQAFEELQQSPVWNKIEAVAQGRLFINAIDPLVSGGGTANGKLKIMQAVRDQFE